MSEKGKLAWLVDHAGWVPQDEGEWRSASQLWTPPTVYWRLLDAMLEAPAGSDTACRVAVRSIMSDTNGAVRARSMAILWRVGAPKIIGRANKVLIEAKDAASATLEEAVTLGANNPETTRLLKEVNEL